VNVAPASRSVILRRGSLLRIEPRPGAFVRCIRGMVWLTQENDFADRIVCAGEAFRFERCGMALANALGTDAALEFCGQVRFDHAAAAPREPDASVCNEILRIGVRYDPQTVGKLPLGRRIAIVEEEARRMRAQVLWLLAHALKERLLRSFVTAGSFLRKTWMKLRPGLARKASAL